MRTCIVSLIGMCALALADPSSSGPATQPASAPAQRNVAVEKTSQGDLTIQPINHSAIRFEFKGKQYYVDPSGEAAWDKMPKADAIFITHEHGDHLNAKVIDLIKKEGTAICANVASVKKAGFGEMIEVGQNKRLSFTLAEQARVILA